MKELDISDLNQGQAEGFGKMRDFIDNPEDNSMFILKGYAGTGKTYLVKTFIRYVHIRHPHHHIAITAPTNKAVRVVRKSSGIKDKRIDFQTIHKLLGLKESIQKDGSVKFVPKQPIENSIEAFNILVIDEVSMLDDSLFEEIQKWRKKVKIIFMGDPAQIPPVNKTDCIPFKSESAIAFPFTEFQLTEIMRQAFDNPIVQHAYQIRTNLNKNFPIESIETQINNSGHGVLRTEKIEMRPLLNTYFNSLEFKANPDYAKVIAWRNVTVDKVNFIIRELLYGDMIDRIVVGEKLIANTPIIDSADTIIFTTSDEFSVLDFQIQKDKFKTARSWIKLKYYYATVEYIDIDNEPKSKKIMILHEDSFVDFNKVADDFKTAAISVDGRYGSWNKYYEFVRTFADIKYNYAISAHKCQGSTYQNVFILEDDIDLNRRVYERNRIKYTAYSRPTDKLFILKS